MADVTPSTEVEITCWSKALKFLLPNYTPGKEIMNVIQDLCDTNQNPEKNKKQYSRWMNDYFSRSGNLFPPEEVTNMYALILAINSLVQRFRDISDEGT